MTPDREADLELLLRRIIREEAGITAVAPAEKWRGGTGWGAEFAKLCNKPLHVFDQEKDSWFGWTGDRWERRGKADAPRVTHVHFTGTGTRRVQANGKRAIEDLFTRSFGAAS